MSASNETPMNQKVLLAVGRDMLGGMTLLQDVIDLHHHRTTTLGPCILRLEGDPAATPGSNANKGSQLVFKDCEHTLSQAKEAVGTLSDGAVKTWLMGYRKVIEGLHGSKLNSGWVAAGFSFGNTAVPRSHADRLVLLMAARAYLVAHPTYVASQPQLTGPPLAITGAAALALHTQLNTARTLVNSLETDQQTCMNLRDVDFTALYKEVSESTAEIGDQLEDDDPRWEQFGLNIPASPTAPEAVASATLTGAGPGREQVEFPHARRATHYRVFKKVVGVDADFVFVDKTQELDFILKNLPVGATVSVYVIAANEGGEAAPSPTVTKVVGT